MTFDRGTRLGPYEITAKLGEGGMGEVWRATDLRLKREVAIKVLPPAFVADPERLVRFEREAQLLAQLHHPNIASVFGLEEGDGTRALVMELVEGDDLSQRVARGAIPVDESIAIALQIAEALEAAHERGIVHRDLKPANVKVRTDGSVKVLDFGLAKAMEPAGGPAAAAMSPTLQDSPTLSMPPATQLGVILGTAAYMAPEQARGAAVDKRADIWAFGVVLYEMLTGRSPFAGETVSDTLASVLKSEIDFARVPAETPGPLRRLLVRCLERNPKNRLHDIADARLELMAAREDPPATPGATPRRASPWILAAAAVLLVAAGLATGRWLLAPRSQAGAPLHLELALPEGLSLEWGVGQASIALSPDGRRLALAVTGGEGRSGLLLRDLDQHEPHLLAGTAGAYGPFFSPDGRWIGYAAPDALYKIAVAGGPPIRLAAVTRRSRGAVWGKDGYIYLAADSDTAISRVAETGGQLETVTTLDTAREERTHRWPELTSDGKTLLFSCDTFDTPNFLDDARLESVRLATGERHVLVEGASQARLLADDLLLYFQGGNVFVLEVDPRTLTPRGKPASIEEAVSGNLGTGAVQLAVSRQGTAAWIAGNSYLGGEPPVWLTLDGTSSPTSIPASLGVSEVALAPDGRRAALGTGGPFARANPANRDIWIADLERQGVSRLSFNENADRPTWTPDGRRVAYRRIAPGAAGARSEQIVWRPADGSGDVGLLLEEKDVHLHPLAFSPNGRSLVFGRGVKASDDLWLLPVDPPGAARPFQVSPFIEGSATISPDGRWIAYVSTESGGEEVYVRPFPDGAGRWQVSNAGGLEPRWSSDGRSLFFRAGAGRLMRATIEPGAVFRTSTPTLLMSGLQSGPSSRTYGVTPDGRRFLALPFSRVGKVHAVNYADDWLVRARRLLAAQE